MRVTSLFISTLSLAFTLTGCVEPYVPAVLDAPASFLVVDGFINGNGRTRIKLARTANLSATTPPPAEKGAKLFVVDNTGARYNLSEQTAGSYQSDSLTLPPGRQYQLRITTTGGAAYASALVPLKVTPPIDKLAWQLTGNQVNIKVSAHDDAQQARFYRWSFVETWEFTAGLHSNIEYYAKPPFPLSMMDVRTTPIYTCWRTERASTIKQTSTVQLSQDALTDFVLLTIPKRAERFKIRYSVLVSQVAQTAEEFAYYEQLRKNTEAVGTVNDPLPTQLTGNIHRVDEASEPVLGFVGAHTVRQQRLFIDHTELPPLAESQYDTPYITCAAYPQYFCSGGGCDRLGVIALFASPTNIPLDFISDPDFGDGILSASADCADCRLRGSTTKPSFW
ncbi:DUF4249 domain-containing protein [Hymenobacter sp. H14-R3]|uniref:DUF4249 domain-containing protein n=1 Tax=Hymenobacter sp. H14-R3 TaxID=3046308 RepID=UPI0024BA0FCA|nr:DUF4249 domain-containing protein [Hymenobacter sp. H14-R3]MDJ0363803.1 DUF4249 domain-containing protein [Hymenobacter sp. H14-R3]